MPDRIVDSGSQNGDNWEKGDLTFRPKRFEDFIGQDKDNILLLPVEAIKNEKGDSYVLVKNNGKEPVRTRVTVGVSDGKNIEIVSGVTEGEIIILKVKKYSLPKNSAETNPFMPRRR